MSVMRGADGRAGPMRSRLLRIGLALIATNAVGRVEAAAFLSGNDLYAACTSLGGRAECIGYVEGILDAADFEGIYYRGRSDLHWFGSGFDKWHPSVAEWCVPLGATSGQTTDVVVKYLRRNPEIREQAASLLVVQAMVQAWPCHPG
jgi:hypothetical protein